MTNKRVYDYLAHMSQAATDALSFIDGLSISEFHTDKRTQQAVIMSLVIIGEAATKVMDQSPGLVRRYPEIPWRNMRGMRNRITHGYFDINLDTVWETVQTELPKLITQLAAISTPVD